MSIAASREEPIRTWQILGPRDARLPEHTAAEIAKENRANGFARRMVQQGSVHESHLAEKGVVTVPEPVGGEQVLSPWHACRA